MHRVASCAAHCITRVTALDPPGMCVLVEMAPETGMVSFCRRYAGRVDNSRFIAGIGVGAPGTVARFTGFGFPTAPVLFVNDFVGTFLKCAVDVLVAGLAGFRANVDRGCGWLWRGGGWRLRPRRPANQNKDQR